MENPSFEPEDEIAKETEIYNDIIDLYKRFKYLFKVLKKQKGSRSRANLMDKIRVIRGNKQPLEVQNLEILNFSLIGGLEPDEFNSIGTETKLLSDDAKTTMKKTLLKVV